MNHFSDDISQEHQEKRHSQTTSVLLDIVRIGKEACEIFIEECVEDTFRFERLITRQKLKTIETEGKKFKLRRKDNKAISATMMRNLFGSMLYHSLKKGPDVAEFSHIH